MTASKTDREKWMAIVLAAALDNDIMTPDDIIAHASPEVMASNLPPDVMSSVLAASLKEGKMTAEVILRTVGPDALSRYIPPDVLWGSVRSAAQRAGIVE